LSLLISGIESRGRVPSFGRRHKKNSYKPEACSSESNDSFPEHSSKNLFRKNVSSSNRRHGSQKESKLQDTFLSRKSRHHSSTSGKGSAGSEERDPIDLLSLMGFERSSEGHDISFAELLSTSASPSSHSSSSSYCSGKHSSSNYSRKRDVSGGSSLISHEEESGESDEPSSATITPGSLATKAVSKPIPAPQSSSSHLRLSYSPPSVISDASSIIDGRSSSSYFLSSSSGSSVSHQTGSSSIVSGTGSGYSGKGIYYPSLLDDPDLIAEKQRDHSSRHLEYPSYIVSCFPYDLFFVV
jgi:hypothetical protein